MSGVRLPAGFRLDRLAQEHPRKQFHSGESRVDDWLATKALQQQKKQLSVTKVLLDDEARIAGYYTLASGQVAFGDLPESLSKGLPQRALPVAVLAWLGIDRQHQGCGLGELLLAQALRDCVEAGATFPFVAVILDCLNEQARAFYTRYQFEELPGHPLKLFLSSKRLETMFHSH